jgi:U1 small nuclear ribonucleoprotein C
MPKYYCDYCDTFLTHDSPSVRKTHCQGRKHKDNVKYYFQKWMENEAQSLIDATTAAYKAGKISSNPFAQPPPGAAPPPMMGPRPGMPTNFNPMVNLL